MKKLFTLLFAAASAFAAHATDYNVPITVIVNGVTSEQKGVITVDETDGLYNLTVKNFVLQSENGPMGVGNVALQNIESFKDGDATLLMANRQVTITDGDDPAVSFWMAAMLPPVPVELRGKIEDNHLRCYLDINLTDVLQQVITVAIGDGWQMPNQSFEAWHTSTGNYVEPNGWHSFESATGSLAPLAGHHIEKSDNAHTGEASARIYATSIFGIVANGTMTTGRMNAGSMVAADAANHAYLDMSQTEFDGNGDPYYIPLYACPDSLALWVKFNQGQPSADHPYATVSAVITDGTHYQDPEDKEYTNVVAKAKNAQIAVTGDKWVRLSIPFVRTGLNVDPQAVLITISTNADAGQGGAGDEVLVDDIEFVYNAKVTGLKVKGQDVADFAADKSDYEMEMNLTVTADDIEVATNGSTAHVLKSVTTEEDYYVCNITVISADMSAISSYVVRVKSSATAISETVADAAPATSRPALYTLDGRRAATLTPGRVYISRKADGTTLKVIR